MNNRSDISYVIKIKNRYFCNFGKGGRVMTAWCLSGATTFVEHGVTDIFEKLVSKGKKPVIVKIGEVFEKNILEIAEEAHQEDIFKLRLHIQKIENCLEDGLTLKEYLEHQEIMLASSIAVANSPTPTFEEFEFDTDLPF